MQEIQRPWESLQHSGKSCQWFGGRLLLARFAVELAAAVQTCVQSAEFACGGGTNTRLVSSPGKVDGEPPTPGCVSYRLTRPHPTNLLYQRY